MMQSSVTSSLPELTHRNWWKASEVSCVAVIVTLAVWSGHMFGRHSFVLACQGSEHNSHETRCLHNQATWKTKHKSMSVSSIFA